MNTARAHREARQVLDFPYLPLGRRSFIWLLGCRWQRSPFCSSSLCHLGHFFRIRILGLHFAKQNWRKRKIWISVPRARFISTSTIHMQYTSLKSTRHKSWNQYVTMIRKPSTHKRTMYSTLKSDMNRRYAERGLLGALGSFSLFFVFPFPTLRFLGIGSGYSFKKADYVWRLRK